MLVETTLYLVPCLNDCGPYGQCLLLRRHGYLYAGCSCKAGEDQAWTRADTPVLEFPALCLSLGACATLPRLESTLAEPRANVFSLLLPHNSNLPCNHRKVPPEIVLPPDLGLLCPHMSHT